MNTLGARTKRRLIAFGYHAGILMFCLIVAKTGLVFGSPALLQISGALLLLHILTFRIIPVSRRIQEWLIPEAICFGCGTPVELVGVYRCSCGFVPHKERHIFTPCPMCGKNFSWVVCPVCETSILI